MKAFYISAIVPGFTRYGSSTELQYTASSTAASRPCTRAIARAATQLRRQIPIRQTQLAPACASGSTATLPGSSASASPPRPARRHSQRSPNSVLPHHLHHRHHSGSAPRAALGVAQRHLQARLADGEVRLSVACPVSATHESCPPRHRAA